MSRILFTWKMSVCFIAIAISAIASQLQAQPVPLKIRGGGVLGQLPLAGPEAYTAQGVATHLGRYSGGGVAQLDAFTGPTTADFSGSHVFVAADGSQLHMEYAGEVELFPVSATTFTTLWIAEFTPVAGASTGRFSNVTEGSLIMDAWTGEISLTSQDIDYEWEGTGWIDLGKK